MSVMHWLFENNYDGDFFEKNALNVNNFLFAASYPNAFFFIKDRQTRLVFANRVMLMAFGADQEIIGKRNEDFVMGNLCEDYSKDDYLVMESPKVIKNKIELAFNIDGKTMSWYKTTKYPLYDIADNVIGLISISILFDTGSPDDDNLAAATKYIKENLSEKITANILAAVSKLSVSTFERRFRKKYNMSPIQYLNYMRVNEAAILLLNTEKSISEIAYKVGYYDQSYFCKNFNAIIRMTPKKYRNNFQRLNLKLNAPKLNPPARKVEGVRQIPLGTVKRHFSGSDGWR